MYRSEIPYMTVNNDKNDYHYLIHKHKSLYNLRKIIRIIRIIHSSEVQFFSSLIYKTALFYTYYMAYLRTDEIVRDDDDDVA